ncbi:hypothetical protein BGW38_007860, partial [Lunasporangiospora selenospora]
DGAAPVAVPPPQPGAKMNVTYSNDNNVETAAEEITFNTCFPSENAFTKYSYINFRPNNATINFYADPNCNTFAFGLDGYYGGYPGTARSFKWVGWSKETLGDLVKEPFQLQGDAPDGNTTPPAGGKNPNDGATGNPPPTGNDNNKDTASSSSRSYMGSVFGFGLVAAVGGVLFWRRSKRAQDKGKGVLPYNRVGGDGDILLTNNRGHNSFELGDEDDEEEEDRRPRRPGQQERYRDDDRV